MRKPTALSVIVADKEDLSFLNGLVVPDAAKKRGRQIWCLRPQLHAHIQRCTLDSVKLMG